MPKSLVIVESPAKAKTINKFLGRNYVVKASLGHVRDLPVKKLAVDVEHNFKPQYEVIKGREKVVAELKKAAKASAAVFLAADPDREGEAICWHLAQELKGARRPVHRVLFNEITKRAVQQAFANPGKIDPRKVEAQQARRILDRLVGYKISPLLWEKVRRGISAGRVQSVALRLVVDREKEVRAFVPTEYWTVDARLAAGQPPEFTARLLKADGEKVRLPDQAAAAAAVAELERATFRVAHLATKERRRHPVPPFITSKLQQEAARKLGFTARKTMQVAQQLYEGIELGEEGAVGLITYMRTDSTRVSAEAVAEVRAYIVEKFGGAFLPETPPAYKSVRGAQEAHEAIRPTSVMREPGAVRASLTRDQLGLYTLIWNRFVASQMPPALFDVTTADIAAGRFLLRATGRVIRFPGFMRLYVEGTDEVPKRPPHETEEENANGEAAEAAELTLPPMREGEVLALRSVSPEQHFTQPPPRYTEATLVKELEERGIGRPSTYAAILSVIQNRDYVVKEKGKFVPLELGEIVVDLLLKSFPRIMDYEFTALMESRLDEIEEGKAEWLEEMHRFYHFFAKWLKEAKASMANIKAMEEETEERCEKCAAPMVIKWGRFGKFLACSTYPKCKATRELPRGNGDGATAEAAPPEAAPQSCEKCGRPMVLKKGRYGPFLACSGYPECRTVIRVDGGKRAAASPPEPTNEICEKCGAPMVIRTGRYGRFLSCSTYPKCKAIKPLPIGVDCPQCGAPLAQKRTKRGKPFYGCSTYPACTFALWDRPVPEPCPQCGAKFLVEKRKRGGEVTLKCAAEGCDYTKIPGALEPAAAPAS
ncbi:MAG: type I DNA topoisomerase [candidate division NC10 bacterium]|nr:type I DNA topoisomerase [candidate division NC10 bacterium]